MERHTFAVRGMDCGSCERRIQRALGQVSGILRSTADHAAGTVEVVLDPARIGPEGARAAIENAGFEVSR